jgi:hypothetical protein
VLWAAAAPSKVVMITNHKYSWKRVSRKIPPSFLLISVTPFRQLTLLLAETKSRPLPRAQSKSAGQSG